MTQHRRMQVLYAIVQDYIQRQEPVGSSSLIKHHQLCVSPATIRADMAKLEDEGYLYQPHTSAGRVPTDKAYRYFVDHLTRLVPLSRAQLRGIQAFMDGADSMSDTLRKAARVLADTTGQLAVVAAPSITRTVIKRIECVELSGDRLLMMVISDNGLVAQQMMHLPNMSNNDVLSHCRMIINQCCEGLLLDQAIEQLRSMLRGYTGTHARRYADRDCETSSVEHDTTTQRVLQADTMNLNNHADSRHQSALVDDQYDAAAVEQRIINTAIAALEQMLADQHGHELFIAGTSQLAMSQGFDDIGELLDAVEEQVVIMRLMHALSMESTTGGVAVAIGQETNTPGLMNTSVVASGYGSSSRSPQSYVSLSQPVAFVGSIGPLYMNYASTIPIVRAIARFLSAVIVERSAHDECSQ